MSVTTHEASLPQASVNSRVVGVMRIGMGIAVLLELMSVSPRLLWLTRDDVLRAPVLGGPEPVSPVLALAVVVVAALSAALFTAGWFSAAAGVVLTAVLATLPLIDQQLYSNHLYLMVLMVALLTAAGPGRALSLDARRAGEQVLAPRLPLTLIRIQISLVYLFAGLAKLNGEFLSGSVLNSYLRADGPLTIPSDWRTFQVMASLSIVTILLELAIAVGLWSTRWRRAVMALGLLLHIGMVFWMTLPLQLTAFALVMFSGYLAFTAPQREAVQVVWDDSCSFCRGWVTWFGRLDWLGALRFVPLSELKASGLPVSADAAAQAMHTVSGSTTASGFRAVITILGVLPASFLWSVLLELPPIRALGDRAYRSVALRRTCRLPVAAHSAG